MRTTLLVAIFALFAVCAFAQTELKGLEHLSRFLPYNVTGKKYCATEDVWKWKQAMKTGYAVDEPLANCPNTGICDGFTERNRWNGHRMNIALVITVLCATSTTCPLNNNDVIAQVRQINTDFNGTGITFVVNQTYFTVDAQYATIAAYGSNNLWYTQLNALKNKHARSPTLYLNVFVTKQTPGASGTLLGIGTFPWDSEAPTNTGGLWVNANYFGANQKTAAHELGHNVGLWHTFHGDSEVSCTSACYEPVHTDFSNTGISNTEGDYCADTPSQPMNYQCSIPSGRDCRGTAYNSIGNNVALYNNIMAYTPDSCMQLLTPQQGWRANCWVCKGRTSGWVTGQCTL